MTVAVPVNQAVAPPEEPGLSLSLRVQLHQGKAIRGAVSQKGNIVILGHGVPDGQEKLILHRLAEFLQPGKDLTAFGFQPPEQYRREERHQYTAGNQIAHRAQYAS